MTVEEPSGEPLDPREQQRITDAVRHIADRRALIEQAKGALMFVYGIDADAAFEILRKQSQDHNVKLRLIAEQMLKDLLELSRAKGPARRPAFDGLMLTAHQRITHAAQRQLDGECKTGVPMKNLEPTGIRRRLPLIRTLGAAHVAGIATCEWGGVRATTTGSSAGG